MEPSEKAPELDAELTKLTGIDRKATIRADKCAFCTEPNLNFRDEISRREYTISGICQKCQDEIWKEGDNG